jgi:hypothetical protein
MDIGSLAHPALCWFLLLLVGAGGAAPKPIAKAEQKRYPDRFTNYPATPFWAGRDARKKES